MPVWHKLHNWKYICKPNKQINFMDLWVSGNPQGIQ